jgi:hypothetical protein
MPHFEVTAASALEVVGDVRALVELTAVPRYEERHPEGCL